jgi:mannose-6-phosphate isomerase-like protein (cupin superfamily)
VEEIWWFVAGRGALWRRSGELEEVVAVGPGVCATIPLGTKFQFRASAEAPLAFVAVTMPPWPGDAEAEVVEGKWRPTVG